MNVKAISSHLANNNLSEEEVERLVRASLEPHTETIYAKGYRRSTVDQKRFREAREARREKEFKKCLEFIGDLTHDKA